MSVPALNVADYLVKAYSAPPCWQLVADVYINHLQQPVEEYQTITESIRQLASRLRMQAIADAFRLELHKGRHGFQQVAEPVDYALVFMGRTRKDGVHHCGLWYQGKVLHALPTGVLHQDLPSLGDAYELMEYWAR